MREFGKSPIPRAEASPHYFQDNDTRAINLYMKRNEEQANAMYESPTIRSQMPVTGYGGFKSPYRPISTKIDHSSTKFYSPGP